MDTIIAAIRRVAELREALRSIDAVEGVVHDPRIKVEVSAILGGADPELYSVNVRMTPSAICHALNHTRFTLQQELTPLLKVLERTERDLPDLMGQEYLP